MTTENPSQIAVNLYDAGGDIRERWFVYFYLVNPQTGLKKRFKLSKGINTCDNITDRKKAAKKLIYKIKRDIKKGWSPFKNTKTYTSISRSAKQTIQFWLNKVFEENKPNLREKTKLGYGTFLRCFYEWLKANSLDQLKIQDFDNNLAENYFIYLGKERKQHNTTRNSHLALLKAYFQALVEKGVIRQNPFISIRKLKTIKQGLLFFKDHHQKQLERHIRQNDRQLYIFIQFLKLCFIRPKELRFLLIRDIDLQNQTIIIPGAISKNKKTEPVVLPDSIVDLLLDIDILNYPDEFYLFGKCGIPSNKHVSTNFFYNKHNPYLKEFGFGKGYSLYSWKHTGIVNAASKGANAKDIQMQSRHHSLDMTDRYMRRMIADENSFFKNQ